MDVPAARRDEVIQIDEGRQQEAGEYAVQIARDRLVREDDDQRPREAAHRRVRRVVKRRARRLVLAVLQPEVAENRTGADRARQKRAHEELAPHRARFLFPPRKIDGCRGAIVIKSLGDTAFCDWFSERDDCEPSTRCRRSAILTARDAHGSRDPSARQTADAQLYC